MSILSINNIRCWNTIFSSRIETSFAWLACGKFLSRRAARSSVRLHMTYPLQGYLASPNIGALLHLPIAFAIGRLRFLRRIFASSGCSRSQSPLPEEVGVLSARRQQHPIYRSRSQSLIFDKRNRSYTCRSTCTEIDQCFTSLT